MKYGIQDWILTDEHNYLGVAPDASWGYDPVHDILEPATSPGNYISLFFDHPEWGNDQFNSHFTEDIVLDDDDFFSTNLTQWDGRVKSDVPGTTTISIHVETGQVPNNYEMYLYLEADNSDWEDAGSWHRINHEGHTDISFYMGGDGEQEFSVFIGNIVPQEPAGLEAQGHFNSIFLIIVFSFVNKNSARDAERC